MSGLRFEHGVPLPLGATVRGDGVRFSVFSRHATRLHLMLFDGARDSEPSAEITLDPETHRVGDIWTAVVHGVGPGQLYAYRAEGPHDPGAGHYFDPGLALVDPYARAVTDGSAWAHPGLHPGALPPGRMSAKERAALWSAVPKSVVVDSRFDWEGDRPLRTPLCDTVIYELHVRGFTRHPSAGVEHPGTYAGLVERIPYLRSLGVTAVELLPVQEFDERENTRVHPRTGQRLQNYWGYSPLAFFAPEVRYSERGGPGGQVDAFKSMVKALHRAGIEVILDVVFNHTAEGNERGPTLSLRGLDNRVYYMLSDGGGSFRNLTGCGNTVNCNHPVVRGLIRDCLHHWVTEMHVDGFRFDLASILGRDPDGKLLDNPPLIELITEDPLLRDTKLIAEAWDAAGAYQVGSFPGTRWSEWNGRYRDDVRRFWRGDEGMLGPFATRICGSSDLYQVSGRSPSHSINFVTSHDGFTLADLVSYTHKHNEDNGEGNADGASEEFSDNHGVEGPTDDPRIAELRRRQVRNLMATLILSQGVPMVLAGDEMGRSQGGNNNAYCHDDETSWVDWTDADRRAGLVRFCRELIALRRRRPSMRRGAFLRGEVEAPEAPDVRWIGPGGGAPDWHEAGARTIGCWLAGIDDHGPLLWIAHAGDQPVSFRLPDPPPGAGWTRLVDTSRPSPDDVQPGGTALPEAACYPVEPHSTVVLEAPLPPRA